MANRHVRRHERNGLTPRELELLERMCAGLCVKQAAHELGISERTAQCQMRSLMLVTQSKNQVQLGAWAERNGYTKSKSRPGATSQAGLITHSDPAAAGEGAGL